MLFEIEITDPLRRTLLKDAFLMDSITDLMDVSPDLILSKKESPEDKTFKLNIFSVKGCHIVCRFAELSMVMAFKNILYGRLIELNTALNDDLKNSETTASMHLLN